MTKEEALKTYRKKPSNDSKLAVLRAYQPVIDSIVSNMLGSRASSIARRRAYILAGRALASYNPESGVPFDKFLGVQLRPMRRIGHDMHEPITIPERHRRYQALLHKAREELRDELDREPSQVELADRTGLSIRQQNNVERSAKNIMSVGGWNRASVTPDNPYGSLPAIEEDSELKEWKSYVYHDLDDVDKQIYDARSGGGVSNNDLAKKLNLTPGAVSQRASKIESRMLKGPF